MTLEAGPTGTRELIGELRWLARHHGVPPTDVGEVVAVALRHARSGGDYPALARRLTAAFGEYRAFALARDLHAAQADGPRLAWQRRAAPGSGRRGTQIPGWALGARGVALVHCEGASGCPLALSDLGDCVVIAAQPAGAPSLAAWLPAARRWVLLAGIAEGEQSAAADALAARADALDEAEELAGLLPPLRRRRLIANDRGDGDWLVAARGVPLP